MNDELSLSAEARSLWGKTNRKDESEWLPLYVHMADSAAIAERIWQHWLPEGTQHVIARDVGNDKELAKKVSVFLAGVHDIGKATPIFQSKPICFDPSGNGLSLAWKPRKAGLAVRDDFRNTNHPSHPIAGQTILEAFLEDGSGWDNDAARSYASVVGGHHGTPPTNGKVWDATEVERDETGADDSGWTDAQHELIEFALRCAGLHDGALRSLGQYLLSAESAVILTGLTIMADWIASNSDTDMFPLVPLIPSQIKKDDSDCADPTAVRNECDITTWSGLDERARRAWQNLDLSAAWKPLRFHGDYRDFFRSRFSLPEGAQPRPVQLEAIRIADTVESPGLMVIEAPMGEGKTEAALAAAEVLARRTGRGGVCVALPTMATTDAMFGRVHEWLESLPQQNAESEKSIWLAHGKAQLNDEFQGIISASHGHFSSMDDDSSEIRNPNPFKKTIPEVVVSDWLWGRKKGLLANFLICTVDQVLMGALQMKHVVLRQLALANKVVIIDECHAYDSYMREYLNRILEWLGGSGTPVILLSATLPEQQRSAMIEAYQLGQSAALPKEKSKPIKLDVRTRGIKPGMGRRPDLVKTEVSNCNEAHGYPLITYTDGAHVRSVDINPSGRSMEVRCQVIADADERLIGVVDNLLQDGGCIGIICNTVHRAQAAAALMKRHFGSDAVRLAHSRFIDIDRMGNEQELRELLGKNSTKQNGKRPDRLIVAGTQVLEQSLDIDFDALVTDIAPIDLVMQRLGRVHRHRRGDGECDRPRGLRRAACYIRGVDSWDDDGVPHFAKGLTAVYDEASLLESLAVLGLTVPAAQSPQKLPSDIARTVRDAYGGKRLAFVPEGWRTQYLKASEIRMQRQKEKENRAHGYLMRSLKEMNSNRQSLTEWFSDRKVVDPNDDEGARAVRDTQETVEVMLLVKDSGQMRPLPWVSDGRSVRGGDPIPSRLVPEEPLAKVMAQSTVRLPASLCVSDKLDELIAQLEDGCADEAEPWQESPWLAGKLALFLDDVDGDGTRFETTVCGQKLIYSKADGLILS